MDEFLIYATAFITTKAGTAATATIVNYNVIIDVFITSELLTCSMIQAQVMSHFLFVWGSTCYRYCYYDLATGILTLTATMILITGDLAFTTTKNTLPLKSLISLPSAMLATYNTEVTITGLLITKFRPIL